MFYCSSGEVFELLNSLFNASESLVIETLFSVKMSNVFDFEGSGPMEVIEEGYVYSKDFGPMGVAEE